MDTAELLDALSGWGRDLLAAAPLAGGWNSTVWLVHAADGRYVAKLADAQDSAGFRSGLRVARRAAARGFSSGPPVPRPDGALSISLPAGELALLRYVAGRRPDASAPSDLHRMGAALARAHVTLAADTGCLDRRLRWPWQWADDALASIPMPVGVRDAARRTLDEARRVAESADLAVGVVHGDPAYDAFVLHPTSTEQDGIIDWSATMGAPALYDLGTVAGTVAGTDAALDAFLQGYLDVIPAAIEELAQLATFTKLRWMCTAVYLADRIARGIERGGSHEANRRALARAHAAMTTGS